MEPDSKVPGCIVAVLFAVSAVIALAILGVAVWAVITLVQWVVR